MDTDEPFNRIVSLNSSRDTSSLAAKLLSGNPRAFAGKSIEAALKLVVQPLTTTGIVVIFGIFILQRPDLRNRFIHLAGSSDMQRTRAALDDAGEWLGNDRDQLISVVPAICGKGTSDVFTIKSDSGAQSSRRTP